MKVQLEPGLYVAAVSGGLDSMVMLDLLQRQPEIHLVVAHYDHGIRPDSANDRRFVERAAKKYGLDFIYEAGKLGPNASEATARQARYKFLQKVRVAQDARAVVTAHHLDDALETAIHNIYRGTGRKGLSALNNTAYVKRPLLNFTKRELLAYAQSHNVKWQEDSTNLTLRYRRNYIRHRVMPKLAEAQRQQLIEYITTARHLNDRIDALLEEQFHLQPRADQLDRGWYVSLPHMVAREVMAAWLRRHHVRQFDKKRLENLVRAAKTYAAGKVANVNGNYDMHITADNLALIRRDR